MATTADPIYEVALAILPGLLANDRYSRDNDAVKDAVDKAFELGDYFAAVLAAH